ncbi:MAG: SgcJ/EcaC family oxidoreductase [Planctomycetaceae bacterium]|nr:SgcJ/EcaC family oxidoreductase [Planctomycetaceae bacterium]
MFRLLFSGLFLVCLSVLPVNGEEQEIQERIKAYVEAFNQAAADQLAEMHTSEALWTLPSGETLNGREEFRAQFKAFFESTKNARLELSETQIELVSPHVGIERGIARVIIPDEEPSSSTYEVVHLKTADGWRIDRITEQDLAPAPPSHYERLKSLEWMIGNWSHSTEDSSISISSRWTSNQNFILRTFRVTGLTAEDFEGSQIIGWDPTSNTIRSWTFDSDGGFGVGRWQESENRWTVQTLQTLPDGRQASATQIYDVLDENQIQYSSIGRQIDGELLPSVGPVIVTRNND